MEKTLTAKTSKAPATSLEQSRYPDLLAAIDMAPTASGSRLAN